MATLTKLLLITLLVLLAGPVVAALSGMAKLGGDWRTANRDSAGIAPDPAKLREPLVQVYGARAFGWRAAERRGLHDLRGDRLAPLARPEPARPAP
jgi:hypothetical protein